MIPRLALLTLIALMATGCINSMREVAGNAPLTGIDGLARSDSGLELDLALSNVNDRPLALSDAEVELSLGGGDPVTARESVSLTIAPRGREVLRISLPPERVHLEQLDELSSGQRKNLPWKMSLKLWQPDGPRIDTEAEGWLHPVPGRENRFR